MSIIYRSLLVIITTAFLIVPGLGSADMGTIVRRSSKSTGGTEWRLFGHKSIRLDAQKVILKLKKTHYVVYATFHFFNTGDTTTESVGFPKRWMPFPHKIEENEKDKEASPFARFDTWVNGRKVQVSEKPGWMFHRVSFPGHEPTTIRVRYETAYGHVVNPHDRAKQSAYYPFGTGRAWRGTIGKAVLIVDGADLGGKRSLFSMLVLGNHPVADYRDAAPLQSRADENTVRYEIRDFLPLQLDRLIVTFYSE